MLSFVLGGVRSGKTRMAESLAQSEGRPVTYVATGKAVDDEFRIRIEEHRLRRPAGWETVEEPTAVGAVIAARPGRTLIVDCLGFLVTNVLFGEPFDPEGGGQSAAGDDGRPALELVEELAAAACRHDGLVIVVSNEVGQGVVPPYPAGRLFRDTLGKANQIMSTRASRVYYLVAGIPLVLKDLAVPGETARRPGPIMAAGGRGIQRVEP